MIDGASSYQGSQVSKSDTNIMRLDSQSRGHLRVASAMRKKDSVIIDDYQSQGYGMDSEIDAQDLINEIGEGTGTVYIEGDSVMDNTENSMYQIRENEDELNNSIENARKTITKKPKSVEEFDGEEEDMNTHDVLKGLSKERSEVLPHTTGNNRKSNKGRRHLDDLDLDSSPSKKNHGVIPTPKKLDHKKYMKPGEEIFHEDENEGNSHLANNVIDEDDDESEEEDEDFINRGIDKSRRVTIDVQYTEEKSPNQGQVQIKQEEKVPEDDLMSGGEIQAVEGDNSFDGSFHNNISLTSGNSFTKQDESETRND